MSHSENSDAILTHKTISSRYHTFTTTPILDQTLSKGGSLNNVPQTLLPLLWQRDKTRWNSPPHWYFPPRAFQKPNPFGEKQSFLVSEQTGASVLFTLVQNKAFLNCAMMRRGLGWVGLASHRRHSQGFSLACLQLQVKVYYKCED